MQSWPQILSGTQNSSIKIGENTVLPIALDPVGRRCAIANDSGILVLQFDDQDPMELTAWTAGYAS